jgi:hypothetical protein
MEPGLAFFLGMIALAAPGVQQDALGTAVMVKDDDWIARLERSLERLERLESENVSLKRRVHLLELYIDSEKREREGWTLDRVRDAWRGKRPAPEFGPL